MRTRNYKKHDQYEDIVEYKIRFLARKAVSKALSNGDLAKAKCCALCKEKKNLDAHHIDYGKPLDVKWLCRQCHGVVHTEGHEWNPDNNEQTGREYIRLDSSETVSVSFAIPIDEYIQIMMECEHKVISIACRLRQILMESRKDKNERKNDEPQPARKSRVPRMEPDETILLKSEFQPFSKPRRDWVHNMHGVGGKFCKVLRADGADAGELQRAGSSK